MPTTEEAGETLPAGNRELQELSEVGCWTSSGIVAALAPEAAKNLTIEVKLFLVSLRTKDIEAGQGLTGALDRALDLARGAVLLMSALWMAALDHAQGAGLPSASTGNRLRLKDWIPTLIRLLRARSRTTRDLVARCESRLYACLDLYVCLAVIEGRRQGKVRVLGGIRIVRERLPNKAVAIGKRNPIEASVAQPS